MGLTFIAHVTTEMFRNVLYKKPGTEIPTQTNKKPPSYVPTLGGRNSANTQARVKRSPARQQESGGGLKKGARIESKRQDAGNPSTSRGLPNEGRSCVTEGAFFDCIDSRPSIGRPGVSPSRTELMLLTKRSIVHLTPEITARQAAITAEIWSSALDGPKGLERCVGQHQQVLLHLPRRSAAQQIAGQKHFPATRRSLSRWANDGGDSSEDDNKVVLWASRVAAAIGMHEHVPRHVAFEECWERRNKHHLNQVKGLIKSRQGIKVTSPEEELRMAIKQTGTEDIIKEALAITLLDKSFHGANAAKEEAHNRLDRRARVIAAGMLRSDIDAVRCMSPAEKEKATLLGESMLRKGTSIEVIEREMTRHLSMANVPRSQAKEVVASSISSVNSFIRLVEKEVVDEINTEYGKSSEMSGIDQFTKETGLLVSRAGENYTKILPAWHSANPQVTTVLGGRPDGVVTVSHPGRDKLVEVKSRMHTLLDKIPMYEQVQMHVLLFALDLDECYHVQTLRGRDKTEVKITEFKKDAKLWDETILPLAVQFSCGYLDLLNDLDRAEEYIKADAKRKEEMLDDVFAQYPLDQIRLGPRGVWG